jgi:hypothetical protein
LAFSFCGIVGSAYTIRGEAVSLPERIPLMRRLLGERLVSWSD